jgi:hypothetical protein
MALIFGETDARFHRRKGRDTVPHLESAQNVLQSGVAIGEYGPQRYLVQCRSRGMHVLDHWHDRIVHTTFLTSDDSTVLHDQSRKKIDIARRVQTYGTLV